MKHSEFYDSMRPQTKLLYCLGILKLKEKTGQTGYFTFRYWNPFTWIFIIVFPLISITLSILSGFLTFVNCLRSGVEIQKKPKNQKDEQRN